MNKVGLRLLREVPLLVTAFFALYGCATQPDGEVSASGVCQETLVQGADLNYGTDNSINDYEHEGTGWINPTTGEFCIESGGKISKDGTLIAEGPAVKLCSERIGSMPDRVIQRLHSGRVDVDIAPCS